MIFKIPWKVYQSLLKFQDSLKFCEELLGRKNINISKLMFRAL